MPFRAVAPSPKHSNLSMSCFLGGGDFQNFGAYRKTRLFVSSISGTLLNPGHVLNKLMYQSADSGSKILELT